MFVNSVALLNLDQFCFLIVQCFVTQARGSDDDERVHTHRDELGVPAKGPQELVQKTHVPWINVQIVSPHSHMHACIVT